MSASLAAMKTIPKTEVVTFCINANPSAKSSVDAYFGYIAEFLSSEKEVVIKPLNAGNRESLAKRQALKDNPYLISLEIRVEGIFLRVHPDLQTESYQNFNLMVDFKGVKTPIGEITGFLPVKNYSLISDVYETYYQSVLKAARTVVTEKKQP